MLYFSKCMYEFVSAASERELKDALKMPYLFPKTQGFL